MIINVNIVPPPCFPSVDLTMVVYIQFRIATPLQGIRQWNATFEGFECSLLPFTCVTHVN